jgi:hypothetical protein
LKKLLYILFLLPTVLFAQQLNLPLNRLFSLNTEVILADSLFYSNFKPCIESHSINLTNYIYSNTKTYNKQHRGINNVEPWKARIDKREFKEKFADKFVQESLIIINDTADKFYLTIDPLFNFEFGKDFADKTGEKLFKNTRGLLVRGNIGKKFSFESSFYENQATYTKYIDDYIVSTNKLFPQSANYVYDVVPGQGRSKVFKKNGYDYAMASGYISYSPIKLFNIQVGHGKHFVGDGYRSLLLSDNAFNYPYARITTTYKNIQYTNLYTSFMNLTDGGAKTPAHVERLFQKKIGSFQLLSVNLFKRLQLGLFQGMIWEAADSNNNQQVNFNTFDPVIGVNALSYGLHNKNNVLLGGTLKLKITKSISLYGQYMLDDMYSKTNRGNIRKKYGYQAGFNYFDLFTIKNLHLQFEYNSVRPYAYAAENTQQSYTHYNQALAHPLGANFNEMVGFINYRLNNFFIELKGNYAVKGADSSTFNYGSNLFKSDNSFPIQQNLSTITTTQGVKTTIIYEDIHIGYLVNPSTNFNIVIGVSNRTEQTATKTNNTQFVYFGIRTSLANFYYDF